MTSPPPDLDAGLGVAVEHHLLGRPWGVQHVITTTGTPGAPTLVLLHGWPQHWWAWRHVIRALGPRVRIVAIDTRGFGWSRFDPGSLRADAMTSAAIAADVVATMDDLGLDRVHLAGHDWGGWFAFHVALAAPDRLLSVTGLAIMPPALVARQVVAHVAGLLYLGPMSVLGHRVAASRRVVRALLRHSSAPRGRRWWDGDEGRAALDAYTGRLAGLDGQHATRLLYRRMVVTELREALRRPGFALPCPGLVLLGSHEQISHEDMYRDKVDSLGFRTEWIADAGHWLLDEAPDAVVAHLAGVVTAP